MIPAVWSTKSHIRNTRTAASTIRRRCRLRRCGGRPRDAGRNRGRARNLVARLPRRCPVLRLRPAAPIGPRSAPSTTASPTRAGRTTGPRWTTPAGPVSIGERRRVHETVDAGALGQSPARTGAAACRTDDIARLRRPFAKAINAEAHPPGERRNSSSRGVSDSTPIKVAVSRLGAWLSYQRKWTSRKSIAAPGT